MNFFTDDNFSPSSSPFPFRIYYGGRDGRERELMAVAAAKAANLQSAESGSSSNRLQASSSSMAPRPPGAGPFVLFFPLFLFNTSLFVKRLSHWTRVS